MMKYVKGKWVKYSNRIFPKYVKKHWNVDVSKIRSIAFNNFENAVIFQELINLRYEETRKIE